MNHTNLDFSSRELKTLKEQEFFRVKHKLTIKISELFNQLKQVIKEDIKHVNFRFPNKVDVISGKISKGERYNQLPYINLDFPKYFSKKDVFVYRSMFWWGNFFSFTIHLQGKFLDRYRTTLASNLKILRNKQIYFCVNTTPWNYTFDPSNYKLIDKIPAKDLKEMIANRSFIKLSRRVLINQKSVKNILATGLNTYTLFLKSISE